MKVNPDQVEKHLQRPTLLPVYWVSGDEPWQMTRVCDAIRRRARELGCQERIVLDVERGFDWSRLFQAGANLSLFSDAKLIELRLGNQSPGKEGGDALTEYASKPPEGNILLISADRIDRKSKETRWFRSLDEAGACIEVWEIEASRLPAWLVQRAKEIGAELDPAAAELIADRVEGNLLAAVQELEKLSLLVNGGPLKAEHAERAVADSARFDPFVLMHACYLGQLDRVAHLLRGLRREGVELMAVFGGCMWELRRACMLASAVEEGQNPDEAMARMKPSIWQPEKKAALRAALKRHGASGFAGLIGRAAAVDRAAKGMGKEDGWVLLEKLLLGLAGKAGI